MIQTFRCKHTAALFSGKESRKWPIAFQQLALRKLEMLDAACTIEVLRSPPGNRLEKLSGAGRGNGVFALITNGARVFALNMAALTTLKLSITTERTTHDHSH